MDFLDRFIAYLAASKTLKRRRPNRAERRRAVGQNKGQPGRRKGKPRYVCIPVEMIGRHPKVLIGRALERAQEKAAAGR